jgi:hypothetical protein
MDDNTWVALAEYGSRLEADFVNGILEEAGIPVLVKGPITGVFGPGFAGATAEGVTLFVPKDRLEDARDLISNSPEST